MKRRMGETVKRRPLKTRRLGDKVVCQGVKTIDSGRNVGITNPF
ncbi:hypothetical protein ES705_28793 [subsurface metagenome]